MALTPKIGPPQKAFIRSLSQNGFIRTPSRNAFVRDLSFLLILLWCEGLTAQIQSPNPGIEAYLSVKLTAERNKRAVLAHFPESGTAPTGFRPREIGSRNLPCPPFLWREIAVMDLDSIELRLLDIEIQKAQERVEETSFWKRIIPQIYISGSFGIRDIVFVDPETFSPYILPRDDYRLTISLSLSEVLNFSGHSQAIFELEKLSLQRSQWVLRQVRLRNSFESQLIALHQERYLLQEELSIIQELLSFNELRFEQGMIEFDTLMRTRLELLGVRKTIQQIHHQEIELHRKRSQGEIQ